MILWLFGPWGHIWWLYFLLCPCHLYGALGCLTHFWTRRLSFSIPVSGTFVEHYPTKNLQQATDNSQIRTFSLKLWPSVCVCVGLLGLTLGVKWNLSFRDSIKGQDIVDFRCSEGFKHTLFSLKGKKKIKCEGKYINNCIKKYKIK